MLLLTVPIFTLFAFEAVLAARGAGQFEFVDLTGPSPPSSPSPSLPGDGHSQPASDELASPVIGIPFEDRIASTSHTAGSLALPSLGRPLLGHLHQVPVDPSPSTPPGLHVEFPPQAEPPVLERHFAGALAANVYRGITTAVPARYFEDLNTQTRLRSFSEWLIRHPQVDFLYHLGSYEWAPNAWRNYVYMYRPITPDQFTYIFPEVVVNDWERVAPVVAYRIQSPQPYPWQYGKLEIAGVELMQPTAYWLRDTGAIARGTLSEIFDRIARRV